MSDDSKELRELREAVAKLAEIVREIAAYQNQERWSFEDCARLASKAYDIARQFTNPQEQP